MLGFVVLFRCFDGVKLNFLSVIVNNMSDKEISEELSDTSSIDGDDFEMIDYYQIYCDTVKDTDDARAYEKFVNDLSKGNADDIDYAVNKIIYDAMYRFGELDKFLIRKLECMRSDDCKHNDMILRAIRDTRFPNSKEMFDISVQLMSHCSCFDDKNTDEPDEYDLFDYPQALKMYEGYSVISMERYCKFYNSVVLAAYRDRIFDDVFYYWLENAEYRARYHALVGFVSKHITAETISYLNLNSLGHFINFIAEYDLDEKKLDLDLVVEIMKLLITNGLDILTPIDDNFQTMNGHKSISIHSVLSNSSNEQLRNLALIIQN